ncbi:DEAD/DEAH box helicase [Oceanicola sp. 22II-s10i]|uniref:DEAD/DEAH box helicase n=1 Tax=Oceanicola sp. 22II-s10i TaxID=1317116 RepID=UPI000B520B09|nr:DEAD/DEAH box helicase [Oceanicola sp. 22II-s10i]OWU85145.1 DEAD/DEAH box helicase [Oceanicola sp. 22II-s10i]
MIQALSDALSERGYETLTAVQEAVTAPELQDADLLVSAQTGSGKTVGFGLAIGHTLLGDDEMMGPAGAPLALIVAPTRELAFQVMRELGWLYAKAGARVTSCVGGMDMRDERRALERGAHIVVGTPGRLRDHIQRGSLDMSALRAVVLDEADEMLDLGFREDLEFMLAEAPEDRRTLLFSATVPPMIATLAQNYQRDAVRVTTVSERSQHADIAYQVLRVAQSDAENAIINMLRYHDAQNAIVFANTRAAVNRLMARFANRGFSVVCLSGELSQTERSHALQAMRDGRARVCVATDVAARGIDLPNLELVIHAELPTNSEGLLHRSGRTGRAGRKGISALIVTPKIVKRAERLLKMARVQAEWTTAPGADEILRRDEERLLADPVWEEEITEDAAVFADKLLALHTPEVIAAAYLRLYRAKLSAPEDLSDPDTREERRERPPFGPSVWFALSVGRNDRAEPRWLLPLICNAGGMDKDAIGAIRIQPNETYVQIAEAAAPLLMEKLGAGGELEGGVKLKLLDGEPEQRMPQRREDRPAPPKRRSEPKPRVEPEAFAPERGDAPAEVAAPSAEIGEIPAVEDAPRETSGRPKRVWDGDKPRREDGDDRPRKPYGDKREDAPRRGKSEGYKSHGAGPKPRGDRPGGKPYGARSDAGEGGPRRGRSEGYKSHGDGPKPRGDRPAGKPYGARPDRGEGGRPEGGKGGYARKESSGPGGKPARGGFKGGDARPQGAPAARRADASDTSKRFEAPGKPGGRPAGKSFGKGPGKPGGKPFGKGPGKPGGKPAGKRPDGGMQPPRRPRS